MSFWRAELLKLLGRIQALEDQYHYVNVADYSDDLTPPGAFKLALLAAIAALPRPGIVMVPPGVYRLNDTIDLPPSSVKNYVILCAEGYASHFIAGAGMSGKPMFRCLTAISELGWYNGSFDGASLATHAFQFEAITHSKFSGCLITGTTTYAIRANNGYVNDFERVGIFANTGGGIDISGVAINNVNIRECRIYANGGLGILAGSGLGVRIVGNTIEGNKKGGILAYAIQGLTIRENYFERNAETGFAFTIAAGSPENVTVKADIYLLCDGQIISYTDPTQACIGVIIDGNLFAPYGTGNFPSAGLSQDCFVFATTMDNLRVTNNAIYDPAHFTAFLATYNNSTKSKSSGFVFEQNGDNNIMLKGTGVSSFSFATAHNIGNSLLKNTKNYASLNFLTDWAVVAGTTGTLIKGTGKFADFDQWLVTTGDRIWGYTFTLPAELLGKWVWFGVHYRVSDTGSGLIVFATGKSDSDGSVTETATAAGVWNTKSVLRFIDPSDTTLTISVQRVGSGSNPIIIAAPMCVEFGLSSADALRGTPPVIYRANAAPTTGTWSLGDRVVRATPAVGSPKAWSCTVAGTPGTWVSEGNL